MTLPLAPPIWSTAPTCIRPSSTFPVSGAPHTLRICPTAALTSRVLRTQRQKKDEGTSSEAHSLTSGPRRHGRALRTMPTTCRLHQHQTHDMCMPMLMWQTWVVSDLQSPPRVGPGGQGLCRQGALPGFWLSQQSVPSDRRGSTKQYRSISSFKRQVRSGYLPWRQRSHRQGRTLSTQPYPLRRSIWRSI